MAKYSDIKGFTVQTLSTDTVASAAAGGAWASGENLPGQRYLAGSAGTVSSNLQAGGATQPPANSNQINTSIEFDGTNWTAGGTMNTTRFDIAGFGATNTAAIMAGGAASPGSAQKAVVESYNGSAFTETTDLNTARTGSMGVGISTAGLVVGGKDTPSNYTGNTESWNGSAWTEVNDLNSGRENAMSGGTSTAAIAAGGTYASPPYVYALTEQWDGSNWTEVSDLNTGRPHGGSSGSDYTDVLVFGGGPPNVTVTEFWNGSSWTEVADLSNGRHALGGSPAGSSSSAIAAGGNPSPYQYTEEWTAPSDFNQIQEGQLFFNSTTNSFKETITDVPGATWASGGSMSNPRSNHAAFGTQTANIVSGPSNTNNCESYDGSSWTEVNNPVDGGTSESGSAGTATAGLRFGGNTPEPAKNRTESWDGTNWAEQADINTARTESSGLGTQTAAFMVSGRTSPGPSNCTANVESWDGSSWTETTNVNTKRGNTGSAGSTTSGIIFGGKEGSPDYALTEKWNGTSWTEVSDLNQGRQYLGAAGGSADLALGFGGNTPSVTVNTESWNGTTWTEVNNMSFSSASRKGTPSSTSVATLASGGTPPDSTATEEWTAGLGNKTITST